MAMFLDLDKKEKQHIAVVDDSGDSVTYGDICEFSRQWGKIFQERTLIFILSENVIGALLGYIASLSNRIVPLILSSGTDRDLYINLHNLYRPKYLWIPTRMVPEFEGKSIYTAWGYTLVETGLKSPELYSDLALLLPTSGSTGSPKLVRHSYRNIEANAENVSRMFELMSDDRAMAILPMHYTMGLSVVTSHLYAGATVLFSGLSLLDKNFWMRLKDATSFTGVPYSYDILAKMRFTRMSLPNLRLITQGGGKLTPDMFRMLSVYAAENGKKFVPTYGQSECTARMAYLPSELTQTKICSIGFAEPGGQLSIVDEDGHETFEGEAVGEMVYRGENVTLGYAYCAEDLACGDDNHGVRYTGDLARRDKDGCYFIEGRLGRFLKIFGLRIGLDEVELLIKSELQIDCVCSGTDDMLVVSITERDMAEKVVALIAEKTHLYHRNIQVSIVKSIERNEAGKVLLNR